MSMERLKAMEERALCLAEQGLNQDVSCIDAKELGEIIDVCKDIAETKYYCSVVKAMEESDEAEKYMEKYLPEMAYARNYTPYYYATIGRGGRPRRGYSSTSNGNMDGNNSGNMSYMRGRRNYIPEMYDDMDDYHDMFDGESWKYRRNYMEKKSEHGKEKESQKELDEYVKSLTDDILDMVKNSTTQEKSVLKQKIAMLANKIE